MINGENIMPAAISGVKDAGKIRIVLYANGQLVHAPLSELLKAAETDKQPDGIKQK